ncbi:Tyrosine recombinase XerC [anaerobic digester metagenome]
MDEVATAFFEVDRLEGHHTSKEENRYERHIKPVFGQLDLADITDLALTRHKARLLEILAPASTKLAFALLRRMVNFALKRKLWRGTSPFGVTSDFKMPKVENKSERYLTAEECDRLLDELEKRSPQTRDMAALSLRTAMRSTEIFELRGKDIDLDRGSIFIEAKAGKRYELYVAKDVLEMLRRYQRAPQEFIFQNRNGNKLELISKSFTRAVDALKLNDGITDKRSKVWFHTLRHSCISRWAQSGRFSINELMEAARHETMAMTLRYAHLIPGGTRTKIAELDSEMLHGPNSSS